MKVRNTFIIFLVSGLWHGANWTFIVWGGLNALYFLPLLLLKRNRTNLGVVAEGRMLPNLRELWQMGTTFLLTVLAWIFFRAENLNHALKYISSIFSRFNQPPNLINPIDNQLFDREYVLLFLLIIIDYLSTKNTIFKYKYIWIQIFFLILIVFFFSANVNKSNQFIYFQF